MLSFIPRRRRRSEQEPAFDLSASASSHTQQDAVSAASSSKPVAAPVVAAEITVFENGSDDEGMMPQATQDTAPAVAANADLDLFADLDSIAANIAAASVAAENQAKVDLGNFDTPHVTVAEVAADGAATTAAGATATASAATAATAAATAVDGGAAASRAMEAQVLFNDPSLQAQAAAAAAAMVSASAETSNPEGDSEVLAAKQQFNALQQMMLQNANAIRQAIDDDDGKGLYARREEREHAQNQELMSLNNNSLDSNKQSMLSDQSLSLLDLPDPRDSSLLDEEEENALGKVEAEDFITGNVSVVSESLRTGTDNVVIAGGAGVAVGDSDDDDDFVDDGKVEVVPFLQRKATLKSTISLGDSNSDADNEPRLVPCIFHELGVNWLVYGLAIVVCVLCLAKVYQVQETRDLTSRLHEVTQNNSKLNNTWLTLVAERQNLTEHAKIRNFATDKLQMVSPKTENEQVISLVHK